MTLPLRSVVLAVVLAVASAPGGRAQEPRPDDLRAASAASVIRQALVARLGQPTADVRLDRVDLGPTEAVSFRQATPDPASRLGRPMRFVLRPTEGRSVIAVVSATVVVDHGVLVRDVNRGAHLTTADLLSVRRPLTGVPIRAIPTADDLEGGRLRRDLRSGDAVLPPDVVLRRAVEPGDVVTVVAVSGDIEVTAQLVSADGGNPGDVVRVVNPETRRDLRARVLERGRVEVTYER